MAPCVLYLSRLVPPVINVMSVGPSAGRSVGQSVSIMADLGRWRGARGMSVEWSTVWMVNKQSVQSNPILRKTWSQSRSGWRGLDRHAGRLACTHAHMQRTHARMHGFIDASRVESRPNSTPYNLSFFELNGVAREQATKVGKVQAKRGVGERSRKRKRKEKE